MEPIGLEPTTSCMPCDADTAKNGPEAAKKADAAVGVSGSVSERVQDADLAAVIEAWASLPAAVRAGIRAMVEAASDSG